MSDFTTAGQTFPFDSSAQSEVSTPGVSEPPTDLAAPDDVFIGDSADAESLPGPRGSVPGPGIPEALLWMVGMLVVHMIGMVIAMAVVVVNHLSALPTPPRTPQEVQGILRELMQDHTQALWLITGEMGFFVIVAVIAVALRLGKSTGRRLGLKPIPAAHMMLIFTVAIPLSLMCGAFHQATTEVWNNTAANWPIFENFKGMDVNETLQPLGESAPLWLLLAVVAVAPAIGEEVIFRGVIGRGLIARHGLIAGVVMTSLMFAAVHIHPAHAVALLPLAFFIHLVYLATRSFWAPVLLHLLNNSLAAVLLHFSGGLKGSSLDDDAAMPLPLIAVSAVIVTMAAVALWKSRLEYRREDDGSLWDPGYDTVEAPPAEEAAVPVHRERPAGLIGATVLLGALYTAVFVASVATALSPPA